jgi:GntR family transcriptional repressor for pyruvate dehydrogenase complex
VSQAAALLHVSNTEHWLREHLRTGGAAQDNGTPEKQG